MSDSVFPVPRTNTDPRCNFWESSFHCTRAADHRGLHYYDTPFEQANFNRPDDCVTEPIDWTIAPMVDAAQAIAARTNPDPTEPADEIKALMAEHVFRHEVYGDGYHEPAESWISCSCGAHYGGWVQGQSSDDMPDETEWADIHAAHLLSVQLESFRVELAAVTERLTETKSQLSASQGAHESEYLRANRAVDNLNHANQWARGITRHECHAGKHGGWWDRDDERFAACPWCDVLALWAQLAAVTT